MIKDSGISVNLLRVLYCVWSDMIYEILTCFTKLIWCCCCRHNYCWTDKGNYRLRWLYEFTCSRTR